jgi:uncharacterized membrane protein YgcG
MKKIIPAAVAVLLLIAAAVYLGRISSLPERNAKNPFVSDGAEAISLSERQEIYLLNTLSEKGRVYVVTVAETGKYSLERFAKMLAEAWKISAGTDVLLALLPSEERFYAVWGSCFSETVRVSLEDALSAAIPDGDLGGAAEAFTVGALKAASSAADAPDAGYYSSGLRLSPLTVIIIAVLIVAVGFLFSRRIYEPRVRGDGTTYYYPPAWMYLSAARRVEKNIADKYAEVKKKFSSDGEEGPKDA